MTKKKENKIVGLTACILAIVLVCGVAQAQPTPITVPNFSFELDGAGSSITVTNDTYRVFDITADSWGWNERIAGTSPRPMVKAIGWDASTTPGSWSDPLIEVPDGVFCLLLKSDSAASEDARVWQILAGETIIAGETYLLTFDAATHGDEAGGGNTVLASLIYDDAGTLTEIVSELKTTTVTDGGDGLPWDEFMVYFTAQEGASYIGQDIGIQFQNTGEWTAVDNVRLELNPDINFPPDVDAGTFMGALVATATQLTPIVSDDGQPDPPGALTYTWSQLSGPGTATFTPNPNIEDPCVSFPAVGVYELQLSASDSVLDACDVLTVLIRANDDPVAHWAFDTGTGTNVVDSVNNNFGTFSSDPEPNWVTGWVGDYALDVADNSYVKITTDPVADPNLNAMYGAVTVSVWVKVDDWLSTSWAGIVTLGSGSGGTNPGGWMLMGNGGTDSLAFSTPGAGLVEGSVNVKDGSWHHAVGIHNGTTISLYVDGVLDTFEDADGLVLPKVAEVWINGSSQEEGGLFFDGQIDDVRIYNYAISESKIAELLAMGQGFKPEVDAGPETATFYVQNGSLQLDGTLTDETPPTATLEWTKESGLGTVGFSNTAIEDPTATFSEVGEYVLRLTAYDPLGDVYDEITITVKDPDCQDVIADGLGMSADLSGPAGEPDCRIDIHDFAEFAGNWLNCNDPQDSECEFPY